MNLTHWHEFLLCLERAGFRGKKMVSSENAIVVSYALWLIGRVDYGVAVTAKKGIERHHLFPRAYLRKQGITGAKQINQIANMALVEWNDNIAISDLPPAVYWPDQLEKKKLREAALVEQAQWHTLPDGWTHYIRLAVGSGRRGARQYCQRLDLLVRRYRRWPAPIVGSS